ncbi:MAG: prepilin-type N-terminal cleavage/methylation domain-containing protein [Rhodocyclales bacterium]|nr:prepilin-type N-terminal cleavage/methylation domain-containing protein [Rhodocyclales bacterium]
MRRISDRRGQSGFTLVEMIVAITITAILSGIVALFIRVPLQGYFDVSRRAELTDAADLAVRRIAREVQGSLPNSVRVTAVGGVQWLEFIEVRTGGRFREQPSGGAVACAAGGAGAGFEDTLEVGFSDTCFRSFGAIPNRAGIVNGSDSVVVYNLGPGYTGADAYASSNMNRAVVSNTVVGAGPNNEDRVEFAARTFPLASPSRRFFVVSGPVTYECNPTTGELRRHSAYALADAQPVPPAGASALLATGVTGCTISYAANAVAQRAGVVSIDLALTRRDAAGNAETVRLFSQAHVGNSP